jgi:hypothetical protein
MARIDDRYASENIIRHTKMFGTINVGNDEQGEKMKTEEIKQTVKTRYGKFAETGGNKEAC